MAMATSPSSAPVAPALTAPTSWVQLGQRFQEIQPDFLFVVGIGKGSCLKAIPSHKAFLQLRSKALAQLVSESTWKDNNLLQSPVLSFSPHIFRIFHEFLFTEQFPLAIKDFTASDYKQLMEIAVKYFDQGMSQMMDKLITFRSVFKLQNVASALKLSELQQKTASFINQFTTNAEVVTYSDDYLSLDSRSLCEFLRSDELKCEEMNIFRSVIRWAKSNTVGITTGAELRQKFRNVFSMIRFPLMSATDIADTVLPMGILSPKEALELLTFLVASPDKKPVYKTFSTKRRAITGTSLEIPPPDEEPCHSRTLLQTHFKNEQLSGYDDTQVSDNKVEPKFIGFPQSWTSWSNFLRYAETNRKNSYIEESIKLDSLALPLPLQKKILMPNLQSISIHLSLPFSQPENEEIKKKEFKQFQMSFTLKPFIFFKTEARQPDPLATDLDFDVDIEVKVEGVTFFKQNEKQTEVIIRGNLNQTQLIPRLALHQFEKFGLIGANLPEDPISGDGLKDVILWDLMGKSGLEEGKFLTNFNAVQNLTCWIKTSNSDETGRKTIIGLDVHLKACKQLKRLALCRHHLIQVSQPPTGLGNEQMNNLTEFYAVFCHLDGTILTNIHILFPNLKKVGIHESLVQRWAGSIEDHRHLIHGQVSVSQLLNILKIKTIQWIYFGSAVVPHSNQLNSNEKKDVHKALEFLKAAGIQFICNPNPGCNIWVNFTVVKEAKVWKGARFNERLDHGHGFVFEHFELNKIFANITAFSNYFGISSDNGTEYGRDMLCDYQGVGVQQQVKHG